MATHEKHEPTLDDDPGLEHGQPTPEGELFTAAGSSIRDPHGSDDDVGLADNPGLEHDESTRAGRMMTGQGSRDRTNKPCPEK